MGLRNLSQKAGGASRGIQAVRELAADRVTSLGPRLRELIASDDRRALTPESLLLLLINAVRDDDEVDLSLQDLREMGKRNERLGAAAGILGGGPGCFLAEMYCDTALYCLLADCFELDLAPEDIAAPLLVAWGAVPDLATAQAAMDPNCSASVASVAAARFGETFTATKKDALVMLWRLRSGALKIPVFEPSSFRDLFFAGRALQHRLEAAATMLGLPPDAVAKPNLLRRAAGRRQPGKPRVHERQRSALPPSVIGGLEGFGQAQIDARREGRSVSDPRYDWQSFIGPAFTALQGAEREQTIDELADAALGSSSRSPATMGAYCLLAEFDPGLSDRRYLRLLDDSLEYMRSLGFSSAHLTRYEADRWVELHGDLRESFDGTFDVGVPEPGDIPAAKPLGVNEARMVALTAPLPDGNAFFAEHREDGSYAVYSERVHSDVDRTRSRYEETQLGRFDSLADLLRAVGEMFGTPTYWADQDLKPYFPRRRA